MRTVTRRALAAGLLAAALGFGAFARTDEPAKPKGGPMDAIEELLKGSGLAFTKPNDNSFRVLVEGAKETTPVLVFPGTAGWKDTKGNEVYYAEAGTFVLQIAKDMKTPPALLERMAELNASNMVAYLAMVKNEDGSRAVIVRTLLFLQGASPEVMAYHMFLVQDCCMTARKELGGYVAEKGKP